MSEQWSGGVDDEPLIKHVKWKMKPALEDKDVTGHQNRNLLIA